MTWVEDRWLGSAPPQALWSALSDPERLGAALPDVGLVEVRDALSFRAHVRPSTALGITPLLLDVRIAERVEPERVRIAGDGAAGGEHRLSFDARLRLLEREGGGTEVRWEAEVTAYGVLGSVTQRVIGMLLRDQVALVLATAEAQAQAAGAGA